MFLMTSQAFQRYMDPTILISGHFSSYHVMGQCRSITGKPRNGARGFWVDEHKSTIFPANDFFKTLKGKNVFVNIEMKNAGLESEYKLMKAKLEMYYSRVADITEYINLV